MVPTDLPDSGDDRLAAALSSLCLLHCLALPLLLALLPGLAGGSLTSLHGPEWVHWALLLLAVPFSFAALRKGHALHGRSAPAILAVTGFALVAAGALLHGSSPLEQIVTVSGGLVVAAAHWSNWRAKAAR